MPCAAVGDQTGRSGWGGTGGAVSVSDGITPKRLRIF